MRTTIRSQLVLAVALFSVATIALLSYFLISAQRRFLVAQMARHAGQFTETIKSSTRYAMMHNRAEDVHQIIDAIGRQQGIQNVRIFNKEGTIIYSPEKPEIGTMVDKRAEACFGCHAADSPLERLEQQERSRLFRGANDHLFLGIINPIYNEASCAEADCHAHPPQQAVLGVLDVTLSLEEVEEQMAASRRKAVLLTAVTILSTSVIILLLFHRLVAKPVAHLLDATEILASGDLSHRIEVKRNDELGQLQRSFNDMISRLAETQNQLYQSNKLASVGRLTAGIAHEINNPLTGILTYSSLLQKTRPEDSELQEDLSTIVRETKRCREIVKGLLDFSRQLPPRKTVVNFNDIVNRALDIVDHQLEVNHIRVERSLADELPPLRVDPNQLEQVLLNLLVNAADAIGPEGGEIRISTDLKEVNEHPKVQVRISDSGCGIPPGDLDKVFDPFFTTKGEKKGTGLGLAVVWGIIDEHGGTISIESKTAEGTTFTILLPVHERLGPWDQPVSDERVS